MVTLDLAKVCGRMFEQDNLRFIAMLSATRNFGGGGRGVYKSVMEHMVIINLRAINGDRSISDNCTNNS